MSLDVGAKRTRARLNPRVAFKVLRLASGLALVALGLIVWSLVDPRPIPVIVAMSAGQALGTLSFGVFAFEVVFDLRKSRVLKDGPPSTGSLPPSPPSSGALPPS